MATVLTDLKATNYTNVFSEEESTNKGLKNPVEYSMDFDGSEILKWQPVSFKAYGKVLRTSSAMLARDIFSHFKQTFHELAGANVIMLPPNGQIGVELFFEKNNEPLPAGKILNLESLVDANKGSNVYQKMQTVQNRMLGKAFTLNNETKLLLSSFMYGGRNANLPNNVKVWGNMNICKEVHIPNTNNVWVNTRNSERILVRVSGLDVRKVVQEIYGRDIITNTVVANDTDINYRSLAKYEVSFVKYMTDGTFIINIDQFDSAEVERIFMQENPVPQQYLGVQMYNV